MLHACVHGRPGILGGAARDNGFEAFSIVRFIGTYLQITLDRLLIERVLAKVILVIIGDVPVDGQIDDLDERVDLVNLRLTVLLVTTIGNHFIIAISLSRLCK